MAKTTSPARSGDPALERTVSKDGTEIGYWTSGEGPPLVLVHGAAGDHTRWGALLPHLEPHVTVHAMDRRGRGASGDSPDWAIEREFEDVAAVVDAVAEAAGSAVAVYGHSAGGYIAYGAAPLTSKLRRLVLYEGWPLVDPEAVVPPLAFIERLEALLADGKPEAVVETMLRAVVELSDAEVAAYRADPSWPDRVAAAHTLPRELRASREAVFDPDRAATITVPTLLLAGSEGPDWNAEAVAAALPDARVEILDGQGHTADVVAPERVAEVVLAFLAERP